MIRRPITIRRRMTVQAKIRIRRRVQVRGQLSQSSHRMVSEAPRLLSSAGLAEAGYGAHR